jgi:zinc protease
MRLQVLFAQLLLVLVAVWAPAGTALAEQVPAPSAEARAAWGFDRSDLPPHPGARFGVLANGMRYALMRNALPSGSLSVRLRFDAGASVEAARELGFMHLIEHLIFHGTPNIPEGSLALMMAHRGMQRITDFNAFTSYEETVYRLDMARSDTAARDAALMLMREAAGNLSFGRRAVEGAKRKVREEIRARDAVKDRLTTAQNAFFAPGTPIARGPVAGTVSSVGRADGAALRRLYELHYLPNRAVLVAVGDFDPVAAEAEIAARFADWKAKASPPQPPVAPSVASGGGTRFRVFAHPKAATAVTIASVGPLARTADAAAPRDASFLEHLGAEMMGRRLARIAAAPDAPLLGASVAIYDHFSTVRVASLDLAARDGDWSRALRAGSLELGRVLAQGFSEAEFAEQLGVSRSALAHAAAPRTTPALADAIVDAAARGIVFTVPADPAAASAYLARLRLDDVNAAFRSAWSRNGRHIFLSHNRRVREEEVARAWLQASTAAARGSSAPSHRLPHAD